MAKKKFMTLADWMLKNDVRDQALADAVAVTRPYINRIRNGEVHPSLAMALAIWDFTGQTIDIRELLPKAMRPSTLAQRDAPVALRGRPQTKPAPKASKQPASV